MDKPEAAIVDRLKSHIETGNIFVVSSIRGASEVNKLLAYPDALPALDEGEIQAGSNSLSALLARRAHLESTDYALVDERALSAKLGYSNAEDMMREIKAKEMGPQKQERSIV